MFQSAPKWILNNRISRCSFAQVPFRLLKSFHKIQQRLVRELEKKFSGKDVVLIANRRIMAPPSNGVSNSRPRSRTLTAVGLMDGLVDGSMLP